MACRRYPGRRRPGARTLLALLLPLAGCAHQAGLKARIAEVKAIEDRHFQTPEPRGDLGEKLGDFYRDSLGRETPPDRLRGLDDDTLLGLFEAVRKAAFYAQTKPPALGLGTLFRELTRRHIGNQEHAKEYYDTLVVAGFFDEARALAQRQTIEGREPLPAIIASNGMSGRSHKSFAVSEDGHTLTVMAEEITQGRGIIFITHPNCSPSRRANALIQSDPLLRCAFRAFAVALNPPDAVLRPAEIVAWNKDHPSLPNRISYSKADWPGIQLSKTPMFYFLRDGKVVGKTRGKTEPLETRTAILDGLRSIGITACP